MTLKFPMVNTWAFVVPMYDLTDVDEYCPTTERFAVEYAAFGWKHKSQKYIQLGCGSKDEMTKIAKEYHEKACREWQIAE